MGDAAPAEGTEQGAACSPLFNSSMKSAARRLRTFHQWPRSSPVSAQDLVEAGFFYVGPRDEVQCFCCGGVLKDWRPGDCPIEEHLHFFPSCQYIRGEDVGNEELVSSPEYFDTVDGQLLSLLQQIINDETALPYEPKHPAMITEEMRLSTFQNWPNSNVHPEQLARAGFFYTGRGDVVRCFYCDGGLRSWSFADDPWLEHAAWHPWCQFLLQSKGREFVTNVQRTSSATLLAPRYSLTEQDSPTSQSSQDLLRAWRRQARPSQDQRNIVDNVLQMGFDPLHVANLVEEKFSLTRAFYLSESELISDLLQSDQRESSSAEGSRDAVQRDSGTRREEMQSGQQKESDESELSTEERLRRLQEEKMCKVCLDRDVSVVFVPCGHLVACRQCARSLRLCPICRAVIQERVRTFTS